MGLLCNFCAHKNVLFIVIIETINSIFADVSKSMSARQKLEAQLTENNIVKEVRIQLQYKCLLHLHVNLFMFVMVYHICHPSVGACLVGLPKYSLQTNWTSSGQTRSRWSQSNSGQEIGIHQWWNVCMNSDHSYCIWFCCKWVSSSHRPTTNWSPLHRSQRYETLLKEMEKKSDQHREVLSSLQQEYQRAQGQTVGKA